MNIKNTTNQSFSVFVGNQAAQAGSKVKGVKKEGKSDSVYAGNLNLNSETDVRKNNARNRAMKLIQDTFGNDKKIDDGIEEIREHQKKLSEEADMANTEIRKLEESKATLKEQYGVKDDSQEQKDLEFLEKISQDPFHLDKEDIEHLKNMVPLTDYQREALELNKLKTHWQKVSDASNKSIISSEKAIHSVQIERLKSHEMIDSKESADKVMEQAEKEIAGMIYSEAKEKIDQDLEEKVEEAKEQEKAKKAEEKEEEKNETDVSADSAENTQKLLDNLKKILDEEKLIPDDIKGLITDALI